MVALATGKGVNPNAAGEVWHLFEQQLNYPISLMNADEIDGRALKNIDHRPDVTGEDQQAPKTIVSVHQVLLHPWVESQ